MRTMCLSLTAAAVSGMRPSSAVQAEAAVRDAQAGPDKRGDHAGHDEHPLLPGVGDQLRVQADHERQEADQRASEVKAHDEPDRERQEPGHEDGDREDILHRVALAVAVQRHASVRLSLGGLVHGADPLAARVLSTSFCSRTGRSGITTPRNDGDQPSGRRFRRCVAFRILAGMVTESGVTAACHRTPGRTVVACWYAGPAALGHCRWRAAPSCHGETVTASVQRRQGKRMRNYEMMVILDPALEERTVQPSLEQFLNVVTTAGGTVDKVDVWGRRRLAYEIDKKSEGIYTVIDMTAEPDTVKELDRQLNLNEAVLRTKIVRPDHR